MRVAQHQRAPAHDVIDVFVAIDIAQHRTARAFDKKRFAAHFSERANRRIDAARQPCLRALEKLVTLSPHHPL